MRTKGQNDAWISQQIHKWIENGDIDPENCTHLANLPDITPSASGCEDCLKTGDHWVHLRMCLTCGYIGCCNDSKNKHATRHFHETHHPVVVSFEPGEDWLWCYEDELLFIPG
jgi:uncharacterized UBP type Zn finger protein